MLKHIPKNARKTDSVLHVDGTRGMECVCRDEYWRGGEEGDADRNLEVPLDSRSFGAGAVDVTVKR